MVITGAGVSVASGVPPFRSKGGVWSSVVWETNTRAAFRKNPLVWYRDFWIPLFARDKNKYAPNQAHMALQQLMNMCPSTMTLITQNMDGLHDAATTTKTMNDDNSNRNVIEAHGRLGYYKCIPPEDSDTDSDEDEDDDRLVHLGHRRKSRALWRASCGSGNVTGTLSSVRVPCRYEFMDSIPLELVQPPTCRDALEGKTRLTTIPRCPLCNSPIAPQVLLFDEGYHSHSHYEFERMENALSKCDILIFVGTSFHVRLAQIALEHARRSENTLRVYNFNTVDVLEPTSRLNVHNVVGPCEETLPRLVEACFEIQRETNNRRVDY